MNRFVLFGNNRCSVDVRAMILHLVRVKLIGFVSTFVSIDFCRCLNSFVMNCDCSVSFGLLVFGTGNSISWGFQF